MQQYKTTTNTVCWELKPNRQQQMGILTWTKHSLAILTQCSVQLYSVKVDLTMLICLKAVATHSAIKLKVCGMWSCPGVPAANYTAWSESEEEGSLRLLAVITTRPTLVVTQFTSTVNANSSVLVEETIWQRFEAGPAIQKTLLFNRFCSRTATLQLHRFLDFPQTRYYCVNFDSQ